MMVVFVVFGFSISTVKIIIGVAKISQMQMTYVLVGAARQR